MLVLQPQHWDEMERHVRAGYPLEACGLLAGRGKRVEKVFPMRNAAQSPVRYRLDGLEQLRAFEAMEAAGMELVGIFHSHPHGPLFPSPTDVREAAYAVVYVIWAPLQGSWQARGFWIAGERIDEVTLHVEKGF